MKAAVEHLEQEFAFSERRACRLIGLPASTFRYQPKCNDEPLRTQLVELAQERPRFGYRRLHVLLRRNGVEANHRRVWRIYQEAGLAVKRKNRKRLVRGGKPREAAIAANEEWALDFVSDLLATGRSVLSVTCPYNARSARTNNLMTSRNGGGWHENDWQAGQPEPPKGETWPSRFRSQSIGCS